MKELIIAGMLGAATFFVTSLNKEESQTYESVSDVSGVCSNDNCTCEPCLCDPCLCNDKEEVFEAVKVEPKEEVLVREVVESKFDASYLEKDLDTLQSSIFSMQSDMNLMAKKISDLQKQTVMTEEKVREIVKEELEVQLKLMNTKTGKEVTKTVKVQETGSEIVLNPGEILMSVDGVPVNQSPNIAFQGQQRVMSYQTPSYQMNVPAYSNSRPVRAMLFPRMNAMRSTMSVCGPNGCN